MYNAPLKEEEKEQKKNSTGASKVMIDVIL